MTQPLDRRPSTRPRLALSASAVAAALLLAGPAAAGEPSFATSADGVAIAYRVAGAGEPALVFLHGGFCDSSHWAAQVAAFSPTHRVVTLDVAGHGASGKDRKSWTLAAFVDDVLAVMDAAKVERAVLVGSSMGGVIALEAALRAPARVVSIVAVDTLQAARFKVTPEQWQARIDLFGNDFPAACAAMSRELFHPGADAALVDRIRQAICAFPQATAVAMLESFATYDVATALRAAPVPIHGIHGDLYPTDLANGERFAPRYDEVVLSGVGHFPMLEKPEEFNRRLAEALAEDGAR